jgi:hypothetical protein
MALRAVLVTGFEPYGGGGINPSLEVARNLDGMEVASVPVVEASSPKDPTKPKMTAANTPGRERGTVTRRNVVRGPAPRSQLASTTRRSMPESARYSGKIAYGRFMVGLRACAPPQRQ